MTRVSYCSNNERLIEGLILRPDQVQRLESAGCSLKPSGSDEHLWTVRLPADTVIEVVGDRVVARTGLSRERAFPHVITWKASKILGIQMVEE